MVMMMMMIVWVVEAEQVSSSAVVRRHGNASPVERRTRLRRRRWLDHAQLSTSAAARHPPRAHGARSQRPRLAAGCRQPAPPSHDRQPAASPRQQQQHGRRQRRRGTFSWPTVADGRVVSRRPPKRLSPAEVDTPTTMMTKTEECRCSAVAAAPAPYSSRLHGVISRGTHGIGVSTVKRIMDSIANHFPAKMH